MTSEQAKEIIERIEKYIYMWERFHGNNPRCIDGFESNGAAKAGKIAIEIIKEVMGEQTDKV